MKLEIKHLAPYLPYGVKVINNTHPDDVNLVTGLRDETYFIEQNSRYAYGDIENCKLLLRPLSDLTKEIEINGEKFVPIDWLEEKYYTLDLHKQCLQLINDTGEWIYQCDYMLVEHLFEWHFDVFGLIDQNLAIAIND